MKDTFSACVNGESFRNLHWTTILLPSTPILCEIHAGKKEPNFERYPKKTQMYFFEGQAHPFLEGLGSQEPTNLRVINTGKTQRKAIGTNPTEIHGVAPSQWQKSALDNMLT